MIKILNGKNVIDIDKNDFFSKIEGYSNFEIDLGTGDGAFPYFKALNDKDTFFIGLDASKDMVIKYSVKLNKNRKNMSNLMYVICNVENIDNVFNDLFNKVYVNLPWGTLLEGILKDELKILNTLRSKVFLQTA